MIVKGEIDEVFFFSVHGQGGQTGDAFHQVINRVGQPGITDRCLPLSLQFSYRNAQSIVLLRFDPFHRSPPVKLSLFISDYFLIISFYKYWNKNITKTIFYSLLIYYHIFMKFKTAKKNNRGSLWHKRKKDFYSIHLVIGIGIIFAVPFSSVPASLHHANRHGNSGYFHRYAVFMDDFRPDYLQYPLYLF